MKFSGTSIAVIAMMTITALLFGFSYLYGPTLPEFLMRHDPSQDTLDLDVEVGDYTLIIDSSGYLGKQSHETIKITLEMCTFTGWYASGDPVCGEKFLLDIIYLQGSSLQIINFTQHPIDDNQVQVNNPDSDNYQHSTTSHAAEFRIRANQSVGLALISQSHYPQFTDYHNDWKDSSMSLSFTQARSIRIWSAVMTSLFSIGLFVSKKLSAYYDKPDFSQYDERSYREYLIDKSGSTALLDGNQTDEATTSSRQVPSSGYQPCCKQTARLQERYCPCGRAVPDELLAKYADSS